MAKSKKKRSCDGKKKYESLEDAKRAISGVMHRNKRKGTPMVTQMNAYGCSCGSFHIGRSKKIRWWDVK